MKTKQEIMNELSQMTFIELLDYALSISEKLSEEIHKMGAILEENNPVRLAA